MSNTWSSIVQKLEAELASGSLETKKIIIGGMEREFRSLNDISNFLAMAKKEAALEQTVTNRPVGRFQYRTRRH
jgi:hypothetical protein